MKKTFGPYSTYLWTLITILITVAIIFICTFLPGVLWDITSHSDEKYQSITMDLPNVEKIISSSVDSGIVPAYFPIPSMSESFPDGEYRLELSDDVSDAAQKRISVFSNLVKNAVSVYFSISSSTSTIALHTDLWNVYVEGHPEIVDVYYSTTLVLQQDNVLWTVTAYGSPTSLTYLTRMPYSSSDYLLQPIDGDYYERVLSQESVIKKVLPEIFSDFLINSHYFNQQVSNESYLILDLGNYNISSVEDSTTHQQAYTITFWLENYNAEFQMVVNMYQSEQTQFYRIMSITQVK